MVWSLFDEKGRSLEAKKFSNGKTQEDVVNEIVSEIKKGTKIIFIHGKCGTGKSAIALNIAKELGKTSVVVPIKNLQRQYETDYMHMKYLLKPNGEKLKISMITGRKNHLCPYIQENKELIKETGEIQKEENSSLFDIFAGAKKQKRIEEDDTCDNPFLPCKIELKIKNKDKLKKYYNENPDRKNIKELDLKMLGRFAVAPACRYWCPIISAEKKIKLEAEQKKYKSIAGEHIFYMRKAGCPYYEQFNSYINSDVIIFNSDKYLLETEIGRKPQTEVEIIDECDEFLDSFAEEGNINITRLKNELSRLEPDNENNKKLIDALIDEAEETLIEAYNNSGKEEIIIEIKNTKAESLIKSFAKSDIYDILGEEDSYIENVYETSRRFYELLEDSYVNFYKDKLKGDFHVRIVTINLDKAINSLIEKNKAFVFMSGTLHSEKVLKEIFGIKDFKIIEAETFNQGTITKLGTGLEADFSFDSFAKNKVTRESYLKALDKCVETSKKPSVVHVNAFQDLPTFSEIENYNLKNLIASEELIEQQKNDREGKIVKDFKEGKSKILFTTRCNRGIDFPFETCNSVIITKFPYPNTQSLFWRIMKKNKPTFFWDFYKDKAHRELLQRVYRSVRAPNDHVYLLSPDVRVLNSNIL